MTTAQAQAPDWDAELQVYEPHRAGLPKFKPYFRDLRSRLAFAAEFSRSGMRAAHSQTVFGQLWLVLNPLLLAFVYFLLVNVLSGGGVGSERFVQIVGGIFVFYFFSGSVSTGAGSVTTGGRLILNMAFPRLLMPLSAVRTAFFRFLPTLPVFLVIRAFAGGKWDWNMLLSLVFLVLLAMFSMGMAALMATIQVYFRDASSFLPYFLRIWLYLSPVLWFVDDMSTGRFADFAPYMILNPLYSLIGGWGDLTVRAVTPGADIWIAAVAWAVLSLVGGSLFFMSRERDFAVRI